MKRESARALHPLYWLFLVLVWLGGCASHEPEEEPVVQYADDVPLGLPNEMVKENLYQHYEEWKGVPYRTGGMSKQGSDCSWYVHETFREQFGMLLPRSSDAQVQVGKEIDRDELQAGDLVFFKTGMFQRHVGVYLEDGRFMHVSTRKGVTISRLDEDYWREAWWTARRVPI